MIILEIEDSRHFLREEDEELMRRCAESALAVEGLALPVVVYCRITDDREIQVINREQRETDRSTDVLSFPSVAYPTGQTARNARALLEAEYDPEMIRVSIVIEKAQKCVRENALIVTAEELEELSEAEETTEAQ